MPRRRTLVFVLALLVSVAVSAAVWWYFDTLFVFLFLPLVPFLFRRSDGETPPTRTCPRCGFRTRDPSYDYCPHDGSRLERTE